MEWISLKSNSLSKIRYREDVLEVEFSNGQTYVYGGVPGHVFDGLKRAESSGKYFNEKIKGQFKYSKVQFVLRQFQLRQFEQK